MSAALSVDSFAQTWQHEELLESMQFGRVAAAIFERRFSACRLMANVLVSWQSMHAIHISVVDIALQHEKNYRRRRLSIGKP